MQNEKLENVIKCCDRTGKQRFLNSVFKFWTEFFELQNLKTFSNVVTSPGKDLARICRIGAQNYQNQKFFLYWFHPEKTEVFEFGFQNLDRNFRNANFSNVVTSPGKTAVFKIRHSN